MPEKPYPGSDAAEVLKQDLEKLQSEQQKEIDDAIYLGLTPEEAKRLESRRTLIKELRNKLHGLERLSSPYK